MYELWGFFKKNFPDGRPEIIDTSDNPQELFEFLLTHWMEDEGEPATYVCCHENGSPAYTVQRPNDSPETAIAISNHSGDIQKYTCKYVLDSNGHYLRTEISPPLPPKDRFTV